MKFSYPAIILRDAPDIYGIAFPDLAVYPVGTSQAAVICDAHAALKAHIETTLEEGAELREPTPVDQIALDAFDNPVRIVMINVDVRAKADAVRITMPRDLLAAIAQRTRNRSRFIAEAVRDKLAADEADKFR